MLVASVQSGPDTSGETPEGSGTDMGDVDLDAIIAAGGSFDGQSTGASGVADMAAPQRAVLHKGVNSAH